jgi:small multidrug resistance pump
MQWFLLIVGIIMQSLSETCMKLSNGFSNLFPSILAFVFWGISFSIFIFALKYFDLSYVFAIYAGIGVVLIAIIGFAYFKEPVSAIKIASIILIALGTAGLNLK